MAGIDKFKKSYITDNGRHMIISIGSGVGKITYTKAVAYGQDVNGMADDDIFRLASLSDPRLETQVAVSDIEDNSITVTANFNNKDLSDDVSFNTIAWFAKLDTDDTRHNLRANQEYLLAITPANGLQTLPAAPPDHRSTQSICINLNMAISSAANVNMTVNQAGVVYQGELDVQLTSIKNSFDEKLAAKANASDVYTKPQIDDKLSALGGVYQGKLDTIKDSFDGKLATKANTSDIYTKPQIDNKLSTLGGVKTVDHIRPDTTGNVDVFSEIYRKVAQNVTNVLNRTVNNIDGMIDGLIRRIQSLERSANDHDNRIRQLEQRPYFEIKTFPSSQEAQARAWESQRPGYRMAHIQD